MYHIQGPLPTSWSQPCTSALWTIPPSSPLWDCRGRREKKNIFFLPPLASSYSPARYQTIRPGSLHLGPSLCSSALRTIPPTPHDDYREHHGYPLLILDWRGLRYRNSPIVQPHSVLTNLRGLSPQHPRTSCGIVGADGLGYSFPPYPPNSRPHQHHLHLRCSQPHEAKLGLT